MAVSVSSLDSHLGFWLRMVSNAVSMEFARKLAGEEVTVAEWVVLRELFAHETVSPSRVADALGLTRGAVSKLADRLVGKGMVERAASAEDGRAQLLSLTDTGRALVPRLARLADANDARFFEGLSARERIALRDLLERLARHHGLTAAPLS